MQEKQDKAEKIKLKALATVQKAYAQEYSFVY
jgi:hypothetical protein